MIRTTHAHQSKPRTLYLELAFSLALGAMLIGCTEGEHKADEDKLNTIATQPAVEQSAPESNISESEEAQAQKQALLKAIQKLFSESLAASSTLEQATKAFTQAPEEKSFQALTQAWQTAHTQYRLSQISDALNILAPNLNASTHSLDSRVDSFPLLPGYLDQVEGYPNSGLVYSEVDLSLSNLESEHQFSDAAYVTLGFHAFDTLLQGDQLLAIKPWQRFIKSGLATQDNAAARRVSYLEVLAKQIKDDIALEANSWLGLKGTYYTQFMSRTFISHDAALKLAQAPENIEAYIAAEQEHSGEQTAKAVRSAFETLASQASLEEAPAQTKP